MIKGAAKVLRRNLIVFKKTWLTSMAFYFVEPLLYLSAMGLGLGTFVGDINGLSYTQFIAPGIIASSAMWTAASESTYDSFVKMHYGKIYHAMVAAPLFIEEVILGEVLYAALKAVIFGSIILLLITAFGYVLSPWALLVPPVLLLAGCVFALLGLIWTGLVPNIDTFSFFFTLMITPMFLFSGVFFPITNLPEYIQTVAWLLPLFHIVVLLRSLIFGQVGFFLLTHVTVLILMILALSPFPRIFIKKKMGI